MNFKFCSEGIFVPIITPFANGVIFEDGINNIINYLQSNFINGVWLLGSYGGFPLLTEAERMQVAEVALSTANRVGMSVIVNVGSLHTEMAVRLAIHAQLHGGKAVASVVPFYYAVSHYKSHNYLIYFKEIVKSVSIPVFFYNNEATTGFKPNLSFFTDLIKIGVHGFKSKGDYIGMSDQIKLIKNNLPHGVYLSGSTSVHLQGYLIGADGVTSGVALAIPKLVVSLQKALESKDYKEAVRLQDLVLDARSIMGRYVGRAVACYDILQHKGVDAGTCRAPWLRMSPGQTQEVIRDLKVIERMI